MAALLPARRAAAAAAAAAASASASSASAAASASASAARRLSSSSSRSLSSVSTAPAAAAAAAAATRAMRAPPPVGNMPEPFAWKEEPAPPTPAGWKATTSAPKKTTRLAGLHPEPHAREKLHALYEQTLRAVRRLEGGGGSDGGERRDNPSPNPYRAAVEQLTRHRMALVAAEPDIPALEEKIGAGQIEELLQQARDELELIPVMASWRPWERPSAEAGAGGASGGPYPAHEPAVLVEDRAKAFLKDMVDTSPREQK